MDFSDVIMDMDNGPADGSPPTIEEWRAWENERAAENRAKEAGPELLAACKEARDTLTRLYGDFNNSRTPDAIRGIKKNLDAVIAKATGEPLPPEPCFLCEEPSRTENPFIDSGAGPFCDHCAENYTCKTCEGTGLVFVKRNGRSEVDYLSGSPTSEETTCDMCHGEGYRQ